MNTKTKILIVDDSAIFRKSVEECLAKEEDIQVIGSVENGYKAIEFIQTHRPDVITLDVEMPGIDGLETLNAIQEINRSSPHDKPIGIIMVSAHTQKNADITIKALEAGAFDFITKPQTMSVDESIEKIRHQLVMKIRYFHSIQIHAKLSTHRAESVNRQVKPARSMSVLPTTIQALCIGVSTGGPNALASILPQLCDSLSIPIFIVQHMPPDFTKSLAKSLNAKCKYNVIEAINGDKVCSHHVYIAPGDKHMLVRRKGVDTIIVVNQQPPENGSRPSVNVLFRSVAHVFGQHSIALILTGMGSDGTKGIASIKRAGGYVIAQDESTSVVWGMPGSAVATGHVDQILPLSHIPEVIIQMVNKSR